MAKIAVLILNYNSQYFLKNCLQSISHQTLKKFDTYFIDNHSPDHSCQYVQENFPEIKIIKHSNNFGIGRGFNLVIKKLQPRYDYFCLLNPDVVLTKNSLKCLFNTLEHNPSVEVVAANIIYEHSHLIDTLGGIVINPVLGIFGGSYGNQKFQQIPKIYQEGTFPVFFAAVTCLAVRSTTFKKYGYFDEDYFMYYEDIDLCWRILLGGGRIQANPKAVVYHFGHGGVKNNQTQNKILGISETNLLTTYYKNLSFPGLIFLLPIVIVMRLLMSLVFLPTSPQITKAKIIGIFKFLSTAISGKLTLKRNFAQKIRQKSDFSLILYNSSVPSSKVSIMKQARLWISALNKTNQRFTGERVTNNPQNDLFETSLDRYQFATKFIPPKSSVLDLACGSGYGSILLSEFTKNVIGADVDSSTIKNCSKQSHPLNLKYQLIKPDVTVKSFIGKFNLVVSFETLEHSHDQTNFLLNLKKYLKPNGTIILSTPDNYCHTHPPQNHFHTREFSFDELYQKLLNLFPTSQVSCFGQIQTSITNRSPLPKTNFLEKTVRLVFGSLYNFDLKYFHLFEHINHTFIYKKIGRSQKKYPYNHQIYTIEPDSSYFYPETSLFIVNFSLQK